MRELTEHQTNAANEELIIRVTDQPGPGGASHRYRVFGFDAKRNPSHRHEPPDQHSELVVLFQNGAIKEAGVNGVTHEALLAIVADRLRSFQAGPYACAENADALYHLEQAQISLKSRTARRVAACIEGTHELD